VLDQQQRNMFAQPLVRLAESMGLQRYFVDVRHAATHDRMPSLPVLRKATSSSIEWLKDNYWDPMLDSLSANNADGDVGDRQRYERDRIAALLGQYAILRRAELSGGTLYSCLFIHDYSEKKAKKEPSKQALRMLKDIAASCASSEQLQTVLIPELIHLFSLPSTDRSL
jgi:ribosomal biogenesis protein LAS1